MFLDKPRSMFHAIAVWGHDMDFEPFLIPAPTEARPGSMEKVEVMRARLIAGEDLHHEDDAPILATKENSTLLHLFVVAEAKKQREENRRLNKFPKAFAYQEQKRRERVKS